jgi:hypothetical protein
MNIVGEIDELAQLCGRCYNPICWSDVTAHEIIDIPISFPLKTAYVHGEDSLHDDPSLDRHG